MTTKHLARKLSCLTETFLRQVLQFSANSLVSTNSIKTWNMLDNNAKQVGKVGRNQERLVNATENCGKPQMIHKT